MFRPLFPAAASVALLLASVGPALSLDGRWESLGPYGAEITALAAAPSNARVLYAGTNLGKIYRSGNAGASWTEVTGDFPLNLPVDDLEIDPRNPAKAYAVVCSPEYYDRPAVGGLFKTVNGGQSWDFVESLGQCQVNDVAIDPRNPQKILAATVFGLYQSTNGGTTWRQQGGNPRLDNVTNLTFDPLTPGVVYAIDYELGFLRSTNGGSTWTVRNTGLPPAGYRQFTGLTVSAGGPKTLFLHLLGFNFPPVYRSLDGGLTWAPASRGLPRGYIYDMVAAPAPQRFYAANQNGLFVSANQGKTWQAMNTPLLAPRRLAVSSSGGAIYAADSLGLQKSVDGGAKWVDANRGLPPLWVNTLFVAPSSENVLYAMGMHSLNGGAQWVRNGGSAPILAVHPSQPRVVFAAGEGSLWKSRDAGTTWMELADLGCLVPNRLVIDPRTPSNLYAITAPFGCPSIPPCRNLRSVDSGATWSCMEDLPEYVSALAIAPSASSTLYAVGSPNQRIFKTIDGGISWQAVHDLGGVFVAGLAVSPEDPDQLWATLSYAPSWSTDGGVTWSPTPGLARDFVVVPAPSNASVLYAYAELNYERIVLRSTDAGTTWFPVSQEGLPTGPTARFQRLSVSPSDPETLFAATQVGLYRLRGE